MEKGFLTNLSASGAREMEKGFLDKVGSSVKASKTATNLELEDRLNRLKGDGIDGMGNLDSGMNVNDNVPNSGLNVNLVSPSVDVHSDSVWGTNNLENTSYSATSVGGLDSSTKVSPTNAADVVNSGPNVATEPNPYEALTARLKSLRGVYGIDSAAGTRDGPLTSDSGNVNASTSGHNVNGSENKENNEARSFASVLNPERVSRKVNFRALVNETRIDNHDTVLPKAAMEGVFNRYDNTLVGFFVGKNVAFHLVKNYVSNTWGKFGFQKLMKNDDGVFLFKFDSKEGVENVLQRGPWIIRNSPLILTKWTPDVLLSKSEVTRVPVWIKLHNVPLLAYSEDGLSLIATQVGKPIMLDAFTSSMCVDSWGRISFARALVELSSDSELKHVVTMAIPNKDDSGFTTASIKVEYEWKPPHCTECKVFGHDTACCPKNIKENYDVPPTANVDKPDEGFKVVQNRKAKPKGTKMTGGINMGKGPRFAPRKQVYVAKTKTPATASGIANDIPITTSNSFGTLEVEDDSGIPCIVIDSSTETVKTGQSSGNTKEACIDGSRGEDLGEASKSPENGTSSAAKLVSDSMGSMDVGSTPIAEKIGKLEKLIIDGKATLVDDDGQPIPATSSTKRANPFSKVGEIVVSDSEDEVVANPFDESVNIFGGGHEFEDEYDEYDFEDYAKQVRDLPGNLDTFNAMYGTTFQGPRK